MHQIEPSTNKPAPLAEPCSASTSVYFTLDQWIEMTRKCEYLPESDMKVLCELVARHLTEEANVVEVQSPVTLCGDIHGQYYDMEEIFRLCGEPPATRFVFMGDFVDRGYYSLETVTRLMVLKARYPQHVTLIRGNHETRQITQTYGFYDECQNKYGNANVWRQVCRVFDLLPIACLVDDWQLCVHGGLSPDVQTLDQIATISRDQDVPHKGAFCDLLWSDPEEVDTWGISPRGAGWLFGRTVTERFLRTNDLKMIARAHQLVQEGIKYLWDDQIVTVWSAPNYCYRCGNVAAVLRMLAGGGREQVVFDAVPEDKRTVPIKNASPYFL